MTLALLIYPIKSTSYGTIHTTRAEKLRKDNN